ncbi:MAG: insulinase family protein [Bacteroidetes bacterium]|nr:insulinase family protein [Bacteroidota bacterium]
MLAFETHTLPNGLQLVAHYDPHSPLFSMNIIYRVGSRDEDPERTGFAHLFEHLMFGGSLHIPRYDEPLQMAGGTNNAFTNSDFTSYYLTLPAANAETAFWLESDRMLGLAFSEKSLEVQRNVVVEEFRQNYLNQPYGDIWLLIRPLAYKVHPYRWPTIGMHPAHIEGASLEDVKSFFAKHYHPANAVMATAGNLKPDQVFALAEKWFGPIPAAPVPDRSLPAEPPQQEARHLWHQAKVPDKVIYKAWHMPARYTKDYFAGDLLSDLLGSGFSSRLFHKLVRKKMLFSEVNAFVSGDEHPGLFIVSGKIRPGVSMEAAEQAIVSEVEQLGNEAPKSEEFLKIRNRFITQHAFAMQGVAEKAQNLAESTYFGNTNLVNELDHHYLQVKARMLSDFVVRYLNPNNCNTLYYVPKQ